MSKEVWIVSGVVVFGLVALVVALSLTRPRHNISKAGYDAIQIGMDERQVEAEVGVPGGEYQTGEVEPVGVCSGQDGDTPFSDPGPFKYQAPHWVQEWHGDNGTLAVRFDENGRVCWKWFSPGEVKSFSVLRAIRRLLHID